MNNTSNCSVSAVIVAAGKGSRMKLGMNKQYIDICGKPLILRTLDIFDKCTFIDEIIIVVNPDEIDYCNENIVHKFNFNTPIAIVPGGETRQHSVFNGIKKVNPSCQIVAIHDGARPFIRGCLIGATVEAAKQHNAAILAVKVKDTIKTVDMDGFVKTTPDRSDMWIVQTPQAFRYEIIYDTYLKAMEEEFIGTDDAMLCEKYSIKPFVVEGDYYNIKITTPEDIAFAETIISLCQN